MKINIISSNSNSALNFKSKKIIYKEFKQIPNLTCACCGKKMIHAEIRDKLFKNVSQPIGKLIKKGVFKEWFKELPIAIVLAEFCAKFPEDTLDKIITDKTNYKKINEACKKNKCLLTQVLDTSHSELRSAKAVLHRMKSFRNYMYDEKQEVYDLLSSYAQLYPRKTLTEIVNLDEVQEFHTTLLRKENEKKDKLNSVYIERIKNIIKKHNPNADIEKLDKGVLNIFHKSYRKNIEHTTSRIKDFLENYLKDNHCENISERVFSIAQNFKIKNSQDSNRFFINAKKNKYDDGQIVRYFIDPYIATFEHIIPKSYGGSASRNNGIILCQDCNRKRESTPYAEFIQYNPQMPYNAQKQILQIADLILQGRIAGDNKDWPIRIANTLYENSDGKINPDITSYCKKAYKKIQKQIKQRTKEINTIQKQINENKAKIENFNEKSYDIYKTNQTLIDEISTKGVENKKDQALLKELEKMF